MINTDEINSIVQSFQNTVGALKSIETISARTSEQLDIMRSSASRIKTATEEIAGTADSLALQYDSIICVVEGSKASNAQNTADVTNKLREMTADVASNLKKGSDSIKCYVEEAKANNAQNTAAVTNTLREMTNEVTSGLKKETEGIDQLRESVRNYTLSTQDSIDELRISQNRSASEIREAIDYAKKTVKDEIDKVSQNVSLLSDKIGALGEKQKKEHTLILVGVIFAALASIASIISLFI